MSFDPQQLGCYFLFTSLKSDVQKDALVILERQIATYTAFTQAVDNLYQEIREEASKDPEEQKKEKEFNLEDEELSFFTVKNVPPEEQISLWRTKLHDVYEEADKKLKLLIETSVCKSNKKAKKRYNKIKNSEEFYEKHVWQGSNLEDETNSRVFLTQLESILKLVNEKEVRKIYNIKEHLREYGEQDQDQDD